MYRTLLTAETVAHRLSPRVDLRGVGREFFMALQIDDALETLQPEAVRNSLPRLLALLRDSPGQVHQLLSELAEGRFSLPVEVTEDARTRKAQNRRARLIATAILTVGISLLLSAPGSLSISGVSVRQVLTVVLVLLYIWLFRQWREMR
jgi:ubiquinone biosynthesis protein